MFFLSTDIFREGFQKKKLEFSNFLGDPSPRDTRYKAAWTLGIFACRWNKELPGPEKVMSKQEDLPTYVLLSTNGFASYFPGKPEKSDQ